jgi:hypothetical protein
MDLILEVSSSSTVVFSPMELRIVRTLSSQTHRGKIALNHDIPLVRVRLRFQCPCLPVTLQLVVHIFDSRPLFEACAIPGRKPLIIVPSMSTIYMSKLSSLITSDLFHLFRLFCSAERIETVGRSRPVPTAIMYEVKWLSIVVIECRNVGEIGGS